VLVTGRGAAARHGCARSRLTVPQAGSCTWRRRRRRRRRESRTEPDEHAIASGGSRAHQDGCLARMRDTRYHAVAEKRPW